MDTEEKQKAYQMLDDGKYDEVIAYVAPFATFAQGPMDKSSMIAHIVTGIAYGRKEAYQEALAHYEYVARSDMGRVTDWVNVTICYITLHDTTKAEDAFKKVTSVAFSDTEHLDLAKFLQDLGTIVMAAASEGMHDLVVKILYKMTDVYAFAPTTDSTHIVGVITGSVMPPLFESFLALVDGFALDVDPKKLQEWIAYTEEKLTIDEDSQEMLEALKAKILQK